MDQVLFVVGAAVVLFTGASIVFTMVLPRRPRGLERLPVLVNRYVRVSFLAASRFVRSYETKDAILAPVGPIALVAQLLFWAGSLILGFTLILERTTHNFANAVLQAAVALFTVGSVHLGGPENLAVDVTAGAAWAVVVALQIAYLPALYAAFNRRESLVAMLESRAGVPAWGPEVLARHQLVGIIDALPQFYADWEVWAAEVAESHTTYPVLLLFRSPEPWFSWSVGLLAVLDGAAMHLALAPSTASSQARLCLRMGLTAFNRIARALGWKVDPDPNPEGPIDLDLRGIRQSRGDAEGDGVPDGTDGRRGVARLPGLAGQLRNGGLPPVRPDHRPAGALVRAPTPSATGRRSSPSSAAARPRWCHPRPAAPTGSKVTGSPRSFPTANCR